MTIHSSDFDSTSTSKRGQCDSSEATEHIMVHTITRDVDYYFEDGSCTLLIEHTLFNVHRSILSKDSSSFKAMFTLPQNSSSVVEGTSDDHPIVLIGDRVSEFKHFLWALYALPPEIRIVTTPTADLTRLTSIARISNKYAFKSIETWALDVIQDYVNQKPSPILNAIPPTSSYIFPFPKTASKSTPHSIQTESTEPLTRLIQLAQMCSHEKLLNSMIALLRQLMTGSVQYAYLAMTLADELDLKALRGLAYFEVMQNAVIVQQPRVVQKPAQTQFIPQAVSGSITSDNEQSAEEDDKRRIFLTGRQQLRLLAGYYRLAQTWEELRKTPPHFDHTALCAAWPQHGCTHSWLEFWKDKTRGDLLMGFGLADVIGRLKQIQQEYDRWAGVTYTYMHQECRQAARRSIAEAIRRVENALPEYFSDTDLSD